MDPKPFACDVAPIKLNTYKDRDSLHFLGLYDDNKTRSINVFFRYPEDKENSPVSVVFLSYDENMQPVIDQVYEDVDIDFVCALAGIFLGVYFNE